MPICVIIPIYNTKELDMIKNHLRTVTIVLIIIVLCISVGKYIYAFNDTVKYIEQNSDNSYEYICTVAEFPYEKDKYINVYATVVSSDHPVDFKDYKILFKVPSANRHEVEYGNTIKLYGNIQVAHTSNNYGNFDYRKYLMSKNTVGVCYIDENFIIECISQSNGIDTALYDFHKKIKTNSEIYFKDNNLALIKSMLTGDRGDIDDDMRKSFQKSGIYHIVAVSGLHTGIFISIFAYILAMLPLKSRFKNMISKLGAVIISVLLLMFTGYGISITRVIFMSVIMAVCFFAKRKYDILISIITAAVIIILITPYNLFNQSFQLSFLSTFGLCTALKIREKHKTNNRFEYIKSSVTISVGSTIATAPLCSAVFGTVSLAGVAANLIVIPLATVLLGSIIVFFTMALILPQSIISVFAVIPKTISDVIISIANYISKFPFSSIEAQWNQVVCMLGILSILTLIITAIIKRKLKYGIYAAIIVPCIAILPLTPVQKDVSVTFVNCAMGECTLLKTPDGKNIMFDCGSSTFDDSFEDLFKPFLKHIRTEKIDTLYISYFDDEHISAVNKMIVNGYINSIVMPPEAYIKSEKVTKNRLKVSATAKRYNIPVDIINKNTVHNISDNLHISTVGDNLKLKNKNACPVYKISYGKTSFVLSSCLGADGQKLLTDTEKCTVLKIPNYGNKVKATKNYITGFKPDYAVITVPENNKYYKVDEDILNILKNNNITTYRTDINQTITFFTDGSGITSVKLKRGE